MSHPTWVRGLKQRLMTKPIKLWLVAPYVGAWIETSSPVSIGEVLTSHPTWVRGLKQIST